MTSGSRQRLLNKAIRKCTAMTDEELEHFLGIIKVKILHYLSLSAYRVGEPVEITTYVPAIGEEFIGDSGVIAYFVCDTIDDRKLAGVRITKEGDTIIDDPEYIRLLPAERIKKTSCGEIQDINSKEHLKKEAQSWVNEAKEESKLWGNYEH